MPFKTMLLGYYLSYYLLSINVLASYIHEAISYLCFHSVITFQKLNRKFWCFKRGASFITELI